MPVISLRVSCRIKSDGRERVKLCLMQKATRLRKPIKLEDEDQEEEERRWNSREEIH